MGVEGKYSNLKTDKGGETAWGISRVYHPEMFENGLPSYDQARNFYLRELWTPMRLDELKSDRLVCELFDTAVNMWSKQSILFAQQAFNHLFGGEETPLTEDGKIGPKTLLCLNKATERPDYENALINAIDTLQGMYYFERGDKANVRGWFNKRLRNA